MTDDDNQIQTQVTPATRILQSLTGRGKIKGEKVDAAEEKIERVRDKLDVSSFVNKHLEEIESSLDKISKGERTTEDIETITLSLMQFKGNVGTFTSGSFIEMSKIMLRWIESVQEIDDDFIEVLTGYFFTMKRILKDKAFSDEQIAIITDEMQKACERYFDKHPELNLTHEVGNSGIMYVTNKDLDDMYDIDVEIGELSDDLLIADNAEDDDEDIEKDLP